MDAGGDSWPVKHTIGTPNHLVLDQTAIKYDDQSVKRHFLPDSTSTSTCFPNDQSLKGTPRGTLGKIQRTNNILEKGVGGKKPRNNLWDYLGEWLDRGGGGGDRRPISIATTL